MMSPGTLIDLTDPLRKRNVGLGQELNLPVELFKGDAEPKIVLPNIKNHWDVYSDLEERSSSREEGDAVHLVSGKKEVYIELVEACPFC